MRSSARRSPASRRVADIEKRIERLRTFENWRPVQPINCEQLIGYELWAQHWANNDKMHTLMKECQALAERVRLKIQESLRSD